MPDVRDLPVVPDGRERRAWTGRIEIRAAGSPATITGYAAVFNQEAVIGRWFRESIAPEAFTAAIGRDDVRALWNHDPNYVLGRTVAKTLRLAVDGTGLRYEVDPPDAQWARDLVTSITRGDVSQSSFAFKVTREEWVEPPKATDLPLRIIREVELFDVSPVTYPAYDQTSVGARDAASVLQQAAAARDLASASSPHDLELARWRVRIDEGEDA